MTFDHLLKWFVAAVALYIAIVTLRRAEFKFPPPVPPIRRSDFPEGYWPFVIFLFLIAGFAVWAAVSA